MTAFNEIVFSYTCIHMQATALSEDVLYTLIPPVSIPLDPQLCSCKSLEGMAEKMQSPVEYNCMTNKDCDGVRCEFLSFGRVYHLETILLSCEDPPALMMVLEDVNNQPLHVTNFSHTGVYSMGVVSGSNIPLTVMIDHHPYSMDVAVSCMCLYIYLSGI